MPIAGTMGAGEGCDVMGVFIVRDVWPLRGRCDSGLYVPENGMQADDSLSERLAPPRGYALGRRTSRSRGSSVISKSVGAVVICRPVS
jgi:hypothetical protein